MNPPTENVNVPSEDPWTADAADVDPWSTVMPQNPRTAQPKSGPTTETNPVSGSGGSAPASAAGGVIESATATGADPTTSPLTDTDPWDDHDD